MFSLEQKKAIATAIEKVLLDVHHPEMPTERLKFHLHVDGKEAWSWADIEPNWTFENRTPGMNPWNELQAERMRKGEAL